MGPRRVYSTCTRQARYGESLRLKTTTAGAMVAAMERTNSEQVPPLIQKIRQAEAIKSRTQPVRVRMDMTVPVGLKRRLQKASTRYGVDMTRIVVELLDEKLPELLAEESTQAGLFAVEAD